MSLIKEKILNNLSGVKEKIISINLYLKNIYGVKHFSFGTWSSRQHVIIAIHAGQYTGFAESIFSINTPNASLEPWKEYVSSLVNIEVSKALINNRNMRGKWQEQLVEMIEIALIDLIGKIKKVPAIRLLELDEQKVPFGVHVILSDDLEEVKESTKWAVENGKSSYIKVKLFGKNDLDCNIIRSVREICDREHTYLIGDVNCGYRMEKVENSLEYIEENLIRLYNAGLDACEDPAYLKQDEWVELQKRVTPLAIIPDYPLRPARESIKKICKGMGNIYNIHPDSAGSLIDAVILAKHIKNFCAKVMIGDDSLVGASATVWQQIAYGIGAVWVEATEKRNDSDFYYKCVRELATDSSKNPISINLLSGFGIDLDEEILSREADEKIEMKEKKRKNLLFIFADQWRGSALGSASEEPVLTPNMDTFCKDATLCDHVFSTFPLCTPHRGSLLTGKYPLSLDLFTNCKTGLDIRLKDEEIGIGQVLKNAGYQTAYIGKWHLDEPERNHSENPVSGAMGWDAFTPPGVRRHGFDYWYSYGAWDKHLAPHYWENTPNMEQMYKWSVECETDKATEYLKTIRDNDKPFALYISWNPPHSPYDQVPDKYLDIYKDREISFRKNVEFENIHHHTGEKVDYSKEDLVTITKQYYAAISGLDDQFERIIKCLKEENLYEDTIIVLSSDHGDMLGSHGLMGKHVWYEEALRVPCIFRIPKNEKKVCHTCMASQDIMPTLLGLLEVDIPSSVEGNDCSLYLVEDKENLEHSSFICACPGRDVFIKKFKEYNLNPRNFGWRGIRTQDYTYIIELGYDVVPNPKRYLYHTSEDKYQLNPLDLDKKENKLLAETFENQIKDWLKRQNDGFLQNWEKNSAAF